MAGVHGVHVGRAWGPAQSQVVSDDRRVYSRSQSSNNGSAFLLGFIFPIKALVTCSSNIR